MRRFCRFAGLVLFALLAAFAAPRAWGDEPAPIDLAKQAVSVLNRHCYRCHAQKQVAGVDLDIRSADGLSAYVVAGSLDDSELYRQVKSNRMPEGAQKLSREEIEILEQWILAGAEYPERPARRFISELEILAAIADDLASRVRREDRNDARYLSLAHLHNNPSVADWEMRLYRAALAKLVNSLSGSRATIVAPEPIDPDQTIFRIDLRDYGWRRADWSELVKRYPYGLVLADQEIRRKRADIDGLRSAAAQSRLPYVRADWLVATASRPPFYERLLGLPETVEELEQRLGVDVKRNFLRGKPGVEIARAGFSESAVSVGNRLLERHAIPTGGYWKSFDFERSSERKNIFTHPLGPAFDGNRLAADFGFDHDGGEMIFHLPNGLQGYYLADDQGRRIETGPIQVVRDKDEVSGTPQVVNGLSCIACHDRGMKDFRDAIRLGFAGGAVEAAEKVSELFIEPEPMDALVAADRKRFKEALLAATGRFLLAEEDAGKDIFEFDEPVKRLVIRYSEDLTVEEVAAELGQSDPAALKTLLTTLQDIGLGPVAHQRTIKRQLWHSRDSGSSLFQQAAVKLGIAIEADN